jgi:hypothetical protein
LAAALHSGEAAWEKDLNMKVLLSFAAGLLTLAIASCGRPAGCDPALVDKACSAALSGENGGIRKMVLDERSLARSKNSYGGTILHAVAARGLDRSIVDFLIDNGADPNERGIRGSTPLLYAANSRMEGSAAMVRALIERGACPDVKDDDGLTPLHLAANWGRIDVVEVLLEKGAMPNEMNREGRTPLDMAISPPFFDGTILPNTEVDISKNKQIISCMLKRKGAKTAEELQTERRKR